MTGIELVSLVAEHLRGKVGVPVFEKGAKDPEYRGDYIGVNVLTKSFGYMDTAFVNVNIHAQDLMPGVANYARLKSLSEVVLPLIDEVFIGGVWLYLKDESFFGDEGTHYQNYKLEVTHINE